MSESNNSITCVGDLMFETMVRSYEPPRSDWTHIFDGLPEELGGPVFNLCSYLVNLGWHPKLIGAVGDRDLSGIRKELSKRNLSTSGLIKIDGASDRLTAILTPKHHYSFYFRALLPKHFANSVSSRCIGSQRIILAGSRHAKMRSAFLQIINDARNAVVAFNPSYAIFEFKKNELERILKRVNVSIFNAREAQHACSLLGLVSIEDLARMTRGCLIVTQGERGAQMYISNKAIRIRAMRKSKINAVGAGDAFFAGFLHAFFLGKRIEEAGRWGATLAASVVRTKRVRAPIPLPLLANKLKEKK